jgi:V8-like Glu-specific endopeptidase
MAAVATAAAASTQTSAAEATPAATSKGDQSLVSQANARAAASWTARRMRAAEPMPLPRPTTDPAADSAPPRVGEPGVVQGTLPSGSSRAVSGPPVTGPEPTSHGGWTYPTPFDRHEVFPRYSAYPYKTVGKLFFRQNGQDFVCSAASIGGGAIWTAGHCVSDGASTFSTNVVFVPQRHNFTNPVGRFRCTRVMTTEEWHLSENLRRDIGVADNCQRADGRTVTQVVGSLGFAWNQKAADEHYADLGYPAAESFTGESMQQCSSSFGHFDSLGVGGTGPLPFAIGCDQTAGTSGGPLIQNFGKVVGGRRNLLAGNNSYRYLNPHQPLEIYSPYFDDVAKSLFDSVVR